jgi:hypothetical protein
MPQLNGQLFIDLNGNGSIDAGETGTGLSGWTVFVDVDGSGSLTAGDISALTDDEGNYSITGISIGTYNIGVLDNTGSTFLTSFPGAANDYYLSLPLGSVTFTRGAVEKTINFETSLSHSLSDNLSITATRQPWLNEGFQFWTDNNNNNRLDARESSTATLFLERTNNSTTTDSGFGFVNDVASGPFGAGRRLIYDRAQTTPEAGELGTFFLRGGGLYTSTAIPTFLMQYTSPAVSGSGTIWDIDTTWNEFTQNMGEQWKVEFLSASVDSNGNLTNINVLGERISPKGQPVWIPNTTAGIATYEANVAAADRPLALVAHNANWLYNPNSLDAKNWQWSFDRPQADVNFVRISFIGQKTLNSDVGFAFDQFKTYAEDIETKNIGVFQLATIGDQVWADSDGDGTQNEVGAGVDGVTVYLWSVGADGVMGGGDDSLVTTTVTSGGGLYEFQVASGSYYVEFFAPDGFEGFTSANQGGDVALDSDVSESGLSQVVTVTSGGINLDIDAGLLTPRNEPIEPTRVGDYVWLDVNKNGRQVATEPGIPLLTVRLLDAADNSEVDITQTNLLGNYLFETQAGTYVIEFKNEFDDPNAFTFTTPNVGSNDGIDSDAIAVDPITGQTAPITLSEGEENLTFDAGLVLSEGYKGYTIGGYSPINPNGAGRITTTGQGWSHNTSYEQIFGVDLSTDLENSANRAANSLGDGTNVVTFGEALQATGNNGENLLRQSTAALLNSYNDFYTGTGVYTGMGVNYPLSSAEVLSLTQLAFASGSEAARNNIARLFEVFNSGIPN